MGERIKEKKFEILNYDELPIKNTNGKEIIEWWKINNGFIFKTNHRDYGYNEFEFVRYESTEQFLYLKWRDIACNRIKTSNFFNGKIGNIMIEYIPYSTKKFEIITNVPQSKIGIVWSMIEYNCIIKTKHSRYGYNEFIFEKYNPKNNCLYFKFNNKDIIITRNSFLNGNIGVVIGEITGSFKYSIGERIDDDNRMLTIIDRKYNKDKNGRVWKKYKYKCSTCGFDCGKHYKSGTLTKHLWIEESSLKKGIGCSCCANISIVPEINSIWAKARWMCDLGISEEDAKKYSVCNGNKIKVICPDCKKEKKMVINKIYQRNSISCSCGDGYSRGHKYIKNILEQLDVKYVENYRPKWCSFYYKNKIRKGEYDFIVEFNKLIIEVDGGFHRKDNIMNGQTKEESEYIDREKDRLAKENGYEVIRIYYDDYIINKNIVKNAGLEKYFNLTNINWNEAMEFSINNLVKIVCERWQMKKEWETTSNLALKFNLSTVTISKYLLIGNELGWCKYNPKDENRKMARKMSESTSKMIAVYENKILKGIFKSASSLERDSFNIFGVKLLQSAMSKVCVGKKEQYKGFTFKYASKNEYERYLKSQGIK